MRGIVFNNLFIKILNRHIIAVMYYAELVM